MTESRTDCFYGNHMASGECGDESTLDSLPITEINTEMLFYIKV